jgi:hypothetical protein
MLYAAGKPHVVQRIALITIGVSLSHQAPGL